MADLILTTLNHHHFRNLLRRLHHLQVMSTDLKCDNKKCDVPLAMSSLETLA